MFQDEGRFGRISDPRRCWAPSGLRPDVPTQVVREYTYAFAAVSPHDGTMDSLILPEVNACMMSMFLEEVATRHPGDLILMLMDQASWHKAQELKIPQNMRLIWFHNAILWNISGMRYARSGLRTRCLIVWLQLRTYSWTLW